VNFSEARNIFGIIFQILGAFMKIGGLRVDTREVQGPFCKVTGIKEYPDLIFNGKFRGPSPLCGGPRARTDPQWTADTASEATHRRTGGTAPPCMEPRRG
jgi:hypothetical protein